MPKHTLLSLISKGKYETSKDLPTIPEMAHSYIDQVIEATSNNEDYELHGTGLGMLEYANPGASIASPSSSVVKNIIEILRKSRVNQDMVKGLNKDLVKKYKMHSAGEPVKLPEWTEKQSMINKSLSTAMNQYKKHGTVAPGTERMLMKIFNLPGKQDGGYVVEPDRTMVDIGNKYRDEQFEEPKSLLYHAYLNRMRDEHGLIGPVPEGFTTQEDDAKQIAYDFVTGSFGTTKLVSTKPFRGFLKKSFKNPDDAGFVHGKVSKTAKDENNLLITFLSEQDRRQVGKKFFNSINYRGIGDPNELNAVTRFSWRYDPANKFIDDVNLHSNAGILSLSRADKFKNTIITKRLVDDFFKSVPVGTSVKLDNLNKNSLPVLLRYIKKHDESLLVNKLSNRAYGINIDTEKKIDLLSSRYKKYGLKKEGSGYYSYLSIPEFLIKKTSK